MQFPRRSCRCLGAALALGAALPSAAIPPNLELAEAQVLDERLLIAQVLERNPGLAALRAAAEAAARRSVAAGALDDPMLSYANAPRTLDSGLDQRVEVSQKFPWPGTLDARKAVSRHRAAAAGENLAALRLEVVAQTRAALAQWRFIKEALDIHGATQALVEESIAAAETRYAAGGIGKRDLLQAEIERVELAGEKLRLHRQRTAIAAALNALLDRPAAAHLPPAAPLDPLPEPPALAALEQAALARHPELARLDARLSAARARVALAEKAFYPDFQLGIGYDGLWEEPDRRPLLSLSLNLPLDRGKRRAALQGANAEVAEAQWTLAERRAELLADLTRAHAGAVEARRSLELHVRELAPLAAEYLGAAIADYRSGVGAFLEVVAAERRKLATELALARTRADYAARLAELERAAGMLPAQADTDAPGAQP
jgi:outer membrane protein, heavy metal efflux system